MRASRANDRKVSCVFGMALEPMKPRLAPKNLPRIIHAMRRIALQTLTWATVAAAVASAVWLAAVEGDPGATFRLTAKGVPGLMPLAAPGQPMIAAAATARLQRDGAAGRPQPRR